VRVLRWFARAGHLNPADAREMAGCDQGGGLRLRPLRLTPMRPALVRTEPSFSLDASVLIEGRDRAGLEQLLRYCARPSIALEHLEQLAHDQIVYRFPKPGANGKLSPLRGSIDLKIATYPDSGGAAELVRAWTDPDFKPELQAVHQAHVLEIPTRRPTVDDWSASSR
jgi:hypothetical protein